MCIDRCAYPSWDAHNINSVHLAEKLGYEFNHEYVALCGLFTAFMVIGRLVCGVHWFTDILGGLIFSVAMISLYCSANEIMEFNRE